MNAMVSEFIPAPPTKVGTPFRIGRHDRLIIEGRPFNWVGDSGSDVLLRPEHGDGLTESFSRQVLSQLSAHGKIRHEVDFHLPEGMRSSNRPAGASFSLACLSPKHRERVKMRYAMVQAVEEIIA